MSDNVEVAAPTGTPYKGRASALALPLTIIRSHYTDHEQFTKGKTPVSELIQVSDLQSFWALLTDFTRKIKSFWEFGDKNLWLYFLITASYTLDSVNQKVCFTVHEENWSATISLFRDSDTRDSDLVVKFWLDNGESTDVVRRV